MKKDWSEGLASAEELQNVYVWEEGEKWRDEVLEGKSKDMKVEEGGENREGDGGGGDRPIKEGYHGVEGWWKEGGGYGRCLREDRVEVVRLEGFG